QLWQRRHAQESPAKPRRPRHICRAPALRPGRCDALRSPARSRRRSEEHTSELQSRENLVCRLLLEKKKLLWTKSYNIQARCLPSRGGCKNRPLRLGSGRCEAGRDFVKEQGVAAAIWRISHSLYAEQ